MMMMKDPRTEAEAELAKKYPEEFAKLAKERAEAEKGMQDLAGKAGVKLPMADFTRREKMAEFNKKYEDFLEGQRQFAPSIYKKRQAELTDLMQRNINFKAEAQQQLQKMEADAMAPLKAKLTAAVARVAKAKNLAFVLNTDGDALPYVTPGLGTDITKALIVILAGE